VAKRNYIVNNKLRIMFCQVSM